MAPSPSAEPSARQDHAAPSRGHLVLAAENGGLVPWCGPAALAIATGLSYHAASELLRGTAPEWYPDNGPIVTAYWRDLLAALAQAGVDHAPLSLPLGGRAGRLMQFARGLEPGWYLLRVTDHFLLVRSHGFGLAQVYDNRTSGQVMGARTHGMRKVSHAVRLFGGPLYRCAGDGSRSGMDTPERQPAP